ncbi:MAG TPA: PKD domain-containing protein, partial [Trebonia sp.]
VDSASAPHVQADYNGLNAESPSTEYSWAGTAHANAADFSAATGQGAHDLDLTIQQGAHPLPPTSPAIDSASCDAPGELATDVMGNAHVEDPEVSHTGNGTCYADRGAYELEDKLDPDSTFSPATLQQAVPFTEAVTVPSATISGWDEAITYAVNFGDGSGAQPVTAGQALTHTYTTPGRYTLTVTAADTGGSTSTQQQHVVAATPNAPAITLTTQPGTSAIPSGPATIPDDGRFTFSAGADDWEVQSATIAWGDGTSNSIEEGHSEDHFYLHPGTYTATVTATDLLGRTSTGPAAVTVGDEFWPQGPSQVYSASVAAHGTAKLSLSTLNADSTGARGAYVDVTVTNPKASGSLTVYPAGTAVPEEAAVQFRAGQAASNTALAIAGTGQDVDFTNGSSGSIDLTIHSYGLDQGATSDAAVFADTYAPDGPVRVLGTTTVAGNGNVTLTVAGTHGVPAKAAGVVLDVTAASTKAAGYVTAYADKAPNPGVHDADWATGQMVTGLATVPLQDGKVVLHNGSKGSASFTADVVGYFNLNGTGSVFLPSTPYRLLDVKIAARQTTTLRISGKNGLPSSGISAAAVNLTESGATRSGTVVGWADKAARPVATSLGYGSGTTTATAALIPVGSDGVIDLYNNGASAITLIVDLAGAWYR